jgi:hypothetical protein
VEVGDLRYPEGAAEDVSMPSPDPSISADPRNYDPNLSIGTRSGILEDT